MNRQVPTPIISPGDTRRQRPHSSLRYHLAPTDYWGQWWKSPPVVSALRPRTIDPATLQVWVDRTAARPALVVAGGVGEAVYTIQLGSRTIPTADAPELGEAAFRFSAEQRRDLSELLGANYVRVIGPFERYIDTYRRGRVGRTRREVEIQKLRRGFLRIAGSAERLRKEIDELGPGWWPSLELALGWSNRDREACDEFLRTITSDLRARTRVHHVSEFDLTAKPAKRPVDTARADLAGLVAETLRLANYKVTRGRDGVFARVLVFIFDAMELPNRDVSRLLLHSDRYRRQRLEAERNRGQVLPSAYRRAKVKAVVL